MASYTKYKSKRFPLKKDANAWAQKEKKTLGQVRKMRIDINFHANQEMPWEAVLLVRD